MRKESRAERRGDSLDILVSRVFPLAVGASVLVGLLAAITEHPVIAENAFWVAGVGVLLMGLRALIGSHTRRAIGRPMAEGSITLPTELPVVFAAVQGLMAELGAGDAPIVDQESGAVSIRLPRSLKSFGETMEVVVRASPEGSVVTVTSRSSPPVLLDYGKNRDNVHRFLEGLDPAAPGSP